MILFIYYQSGSALSCSVDGVSWKFLGDPIITGDFAVNGYCHSILTIDKILTLLLVTLFCTNHLLERLEGMMLEALSISITCGLPQEQHGQLATRYNII